MRTHVLSLNYNTVTKLLGNTQTEGSEDEPALLEQQVVPILFEQFNEIEISMKQALTPTQTHIHTYTQTDCVFLTMSLCLRAVTMTIIRTFCSHTILQKSAMVLCKGPWVQMKSLSDPPP